MGGNGATWDDLSMVEFITRKRIFMKGAQDFLALFEQKNGKKILSNGSMEQH